MARITLLAIRSGKLVPSHWGSERSPDNWQTKLVQGGIVVVVVVLVLVVSTVVVVVVLVPIVVVVEVDGDVVTEQSGSQPSPDC
jgi:hypothetical protein